MQQDVRQTGKVRRHARMKGFPGVEARDEPLAPRLYGFAAKPGLDSGSSEPDEDALAAVLDRWHPRLIERQCGPLNFERQFAVDVRHRGFKPREADLRDDLTQAMDLDDLRQLSSQPRFAAPAIE